TLRWMQVLQAAVLKQAARHEQLAEILLSGLVQRLTPMGVRVSGEQVQFRFHRDAGDALVQFLGDDDARATADLLRQYIYTEFGRTTDTSVWLGDVEGTALIVPATAQPLVTLYKTFLGRLNVSTLPQPAPEPEMTGPPPGSLLATFAPVARPERTLRGLGILWCETDVASTAGEQSMLRTYGARVSTAATFAEAVKAAAGTHPDIVVAPLELAIGPHPPGWSDLLQPPGGDVPVVVYSASDASEGSTSQPLLEHMRARLTRRGRLIETIAETAAASHAEQFASRVIARLVMAGVPHATAEQLLQQPAAAIVRATMEQESLEDLDRVVVHLVSAITNSTSVLLYEQTDDDSMELQVGIISEGREPSRNVAMSSVIGRAASLRMTQWVPDVRQDSGYIAADPTTRSELAIPLQSKPRRVGVLNCETHDINSFSDEQIRWLEALVTGYYPASLSSPERIEARLHADRAGLLFGADRYEEAIEECTKSLAIVGDLQVLKRRAAAYWYAHRYSEAVEDLDKVIAARGRQADWPLLASRGQILVELERYEDALPDLDAAIDAVKGDLGLSAFPRRARAVAYGALKRYAEADADFAASRLGSPQNAWLDYSLAQYHQSRGASDAEVVEWYAAAVARREPSLNLSKLYAALEAIRSLAKLEFSTQDLGVLLFRDREGLLETATMASERGHPNLSVVARAALLALEPTAERHLELATEYHAAGEHERALYHITFVKLLNSGQSAEAGSGPVESKASASTEAADAEEAAGTGTGWFSATRKRFERFLRGDS
ncbi:MAG: GAF domain-containing protein, partial [Candidatus Binatia bacterium]